MSKFHLKRLVGLAFLQFEMNISKLRLYQTALYKCKKKFAEMFLTMLSNKTCLIDFAPPNKLAAKAVDKNYL